jgi:TolA-binding protein
MQPGRRSPLRLAVPLVLLVTTVGLFGGCAYFNTFSNARSSFREAEEMALNPEGKVSPGARKKYDESIEKCRKLQELYPESKWVDDAIFLMSRSYFAKSEFGRCLRRIEELEERFPDHPWQERAMFMRGICHLEDGDEARAIAILEKMEEAYPQSEHLAEGIFRGGEAEYRLGNWEAAVLVYRRLLDRFEQSEWNDEAELKIARSQRELGQDSLAVATVMHLAEVGQNRRRIFEGQLLAATILFEQRDYEACRAILKELEPVAGNFQARGEVLLLLARIEEIGGDLEAAVTAMEAVATEFPRSLFAAEAWYRIGLIRQNREGDLEQAVVAYDEAKREAPRSLFADLAGNKRRAVQELMDFQASFGDSPPDSSAAELQFKQAENRLLLLENPEEALLEYERVMEEYPDSPQASQAAYAIAYIHRYSLADSVAALVAVDRLLERYPDSEAAAFVAGWHDALEPTP